MSVTLFFLNSSPDFGNHFFFLKKFTYFGNGIATIPFHYSPSHFRQWHCHSYPKKISSISAIPLPQLPKKKKKISPISAIPLPQIFFFPHIFDNPIATILFFFLTFSAIPLPQLLNFFFYTPISAMALPQLVCHNFF